MTYQVKQDFEYQGSERWKWWTWIESDDDPALAKVASVVWKLHHSFAQPIVEVDDASTKFRIERVGWGTFTIGVEVRLKSKEVVQLEHPLELHYPEEEKLRRRRSRPQVFLSYGVEDRKLAEAVRRQLSEAGVKVADSQDLNAGLPLEVAIRNQIKSSNAVVNLVTSDVPSRYAQSSLALAQTFGLPVVNLVQQGVSPESYDALGEVVPFDAPGLEGTVAQVLARMKFSVD